MLFKYSYQKQNIFRTEEPHSLYYSLPAMCSREMKSVSTSLPTKAESYAESTEGFCPSLWSHLGRKLRPVCLTPLKKHPFVFSFASSKQCVCMTADDMRLLISSVISLQLLPVVSLSLQETNQMKKYATSHLCEVMNGKSSHQSEASLSSKTKWEDYNLVIRISYLT